MKEILKEIEFGTVEILPKDDLQKKINKSKQNNKPLIIKAGFDPTAPNLHLGHTVLIQKLKLFQELGHEVHFLIGDYTAMVGDPSGKSETRPFLTKEQVEENSKTYQEQVFKVLDINKTTITYNSKWLSQINLKDLLHLTANYTVAQLLERDDFSKRYKSGQPISLVEFLYPLLQGYDSVAMNADIELGGTDQKFNLLVGRALQVAYQKEPQVIITLPLLVGLDGSKKMSKSLHNYVGITEPPMDIFGKILSISDQLMWEYYTLLSDLSSREIQNLKQDIELGEKHPKNVKAQLARELVERFYTKEIAEQIEKEWEQIHNPKQRGIPKDTPIFQIPEKNLIEDKIGVLDALLFSKSVSSKSEAKRLIQSRGIYLIEKATSQESVLEDLNFKLNKKESYLFRIGKRRFIQIDV